MNLRASPDWIVDTLEPRALLAEARALPAWDDEVRANIDHALCQWTRNACARNDDREGLLEFQAVLGCLLDGLDLHVDASSADSLKARWQGFLDLLEAQRIVLAARDPDGVQQRKHVAPILAALAAGETEQKALREQVGLSESRLTQLLHLMEAHGLIVRRKQGRTNLVRLAVVRSNQSADAQTFQATRAGAYAGYLTLRVA